jgi:hypothetical protein
MVFCFVQNFFSDNTRVRIFIFFCRAKREFFFQNLTLGYMTKTLNQIFFFFLHQNQNIFFSNIGNQNICLEKNHNPPPFKLNGRSLRGIDFASKIIIKKCCIWCLGNKMYMWELHKTQHWQQQVDKAFLLHQFYCVIGGNSLEYTLKLNQLKTIKHIKINLKNKNYACLPNMWNFKIWAPFNTVISIKQITHFLYWLINN